MDLGLKRRTALVCASTSGLGFATAAALAAEGARVVITGRDSEKVVAAAERVPHAVGMSADLTDADALEALIFDIQSNLDPIDVLILNGPGPAPGTAAAVDAEDVESAIGALVIPHVRLVGAFVPAMRERGWGRVLSIGSTSVQAPIAGLVLSNLGRAGLAGYLKTLATEVAADGVTVNSLLPGRIATSRAQEIDAAVAERSGRPVEEVKASSEATIPIGRYGRPSEFGAAAAFLCSDAASYITGTLLRCDGGMVPGL